MKPHQIQRKKPAMNGIPNPNDSQEFLCFLYFARGIRMARIAEITGINPNTIRAWKMNHDWDGMLALADNKMNELNPAVQQPHIATALEGRADIAKEYEGNLQVAAKKFGKHMAEKSAEAIVEDAPKLDAADKMFGRRLKLDEPEQAGQGGHISLTFLGQAAEGSVRIIESQPKQVSDKESAA